ncbi:MAG: hypothetical protein VW644_09270, partial [Alphaproteobacteria bacterium]
MTTDLADAYRARFGLDPADDPGGGLAVDLPAEAAAALARILGRRSYRKFADEPVDAALRTALLA